MRSDSNSKFILGEKMKHPKGFRGKYFSLSAILALSTTVTLASSTTSIENSALHVQKQDEYAQSEEETPTQELAPVVVISKAIKSKKSHIYTASKSLSTTTNLTDNVSVLTSQEMKLQGFTTVSQALQSLPGITLSSSGGLGTVRSLFLQGLSNKYTLVLIDGVRYNDPTNTSGADLSQLMVNDIDKIEVIKGAQSGVWGADAAAGVINIITKKAPVGTHATITSEIGSYQHRNASLLLSKRTHKYDILLSVLRTTEQGFSAQAPIEKNLDQYEKDPYRNTTVNLKAGYWLNVFSRIQFGYHDINSLTHYDQGFNDPNSGGRSDYRGKTGYIKYKHFVGRNTIETTISQSYFHNKQLDATYGVNDSIGKIPSFELKDTLKYGQKNSLVIGTNYNKNKIYYTQIGKSKKSQNDTNKALFLNNIFHFDKLVLSQALRYDNFSDFDNKITGKLGAKYFIGKNFNIYVNFGTGYKVPNMMDMINIWGKPNFDLKPEKIKSYNMGLKYFGMGVNIFRNEIQDMISWDNTTFQNVNINGTSVLKGIELSYQQMFFDRLLLGGNYTYIDAKDKDGMRLLRRPRYQIALNTTYWATKNLSMSTNGTYIGSRADKDFSTRPATNVDTGNYLVLNTKVDYKINKTWSTYFKINNLLDKIYQSVYGYGTARRSFYLGVNAKF